MTHSDYCLQRICDLRSSSKKLEVEEVVGYNYLVGTTRDSLRYTSQSSSSRSLHHRKVTMNPMQLCNIQGFNFKAIFLQIVVFLLIDPTVSQSFTSMPFNVLLAQLEGFCNPTDTSVNPQFNGGDDYFNGKFNQLTAAIKLQLSDLVTTTIALNTPAPNSRVAAAYRAINRADVPSYMSDLQMVFGNGLTSQPVYCYNSSGRKVSCTSQTYDYQQLMKTAIDKWLYRYDCDGWKAVFHTSSSKFFFQSQQLNK